MCKTTLCHGRNRWWRHSVDDDGAALTARYSRLRDAEGPILRTRGSVGMAWVLQRGSLPVPEGPVVTRATSAVGGRGGGREVHHQRGLARRGGGRGSAG